MVRDTLETLVTIGSMGTMIGTWAAYQYKEIRKIKTDVSDIKNTHEQNSEILKNLAYSYDVSKKINHLLQDSIKYLSDGPDDLPVAALLETNGGMAKYLICWAMETNMDDVKFEDFLVKYESMSMKLRDYLQRINPAFSVEINKELKYKGIKYIHLVKTIIEDKRPNSKVYRFQSATELILQEIIATVIKKWLVFKNK